MSETLKSWSEPVTRPDGSALKIEVYENKGILVHIGFATTTYSEAELIHLGGGDHQRGILRVGQAAYQDPRTPLDMCFTNRHLQEDLEQFTQNQDFVEDLQ